VAGEWPQATERTNGRKGRTEARELVPVLPVSESIINATLEHLPAVVADMATAHWSQAIRNLFAAAA
jgi:hypothetical protein